jgi:hypothetical protein
METITLGIARAVIWNDSNPIRFEEFCADLVSLLEGGLAVVTTSRNYDQGRDGLSISSRTFLAACCSLTAVVDKKFAADIKKVTTKTRGLRALYICTNQPLTQHAEDKLRSKLASAAAFDGTTRIVSLDTIAKLSRQPRFRHLLTTHYRAEVHDATAALREDDSRSDTAAFRLALMSTAPKEASKIRAHVWQGAIRHQLAKLKDGQACDVTQIAIGITQELGLTGTVSSALIRRHLRTLIDSDLAEEFPKDAFRLTQAGRASLLQDDQGATASLLAGKQALVSAVEASLGYTLTTSQHDRMWSAVQNALATLFYNRGREFIDVLQPVLDHVAAPANPLLATMSTADGEAPGHRSDSGAIHSDISGPIASAAASTFLAQQAEEVRVAVHDVLRYESQDIVVWLAKTCYAFICACALGLEANVRDSLEHLVRNSVAVFDTDVALSLLCSAETNHDSVSEIWKQWSAQGGKLALADGVAFEIAYHAWIARYDFANTRDIIGKFTEAERGVLSKNAFLRTFSLLLSQKKAKVGQWDRWISQYRGATPSDAKAIRRTLRADYGFDDLPGSQGTYRTLAADVRLYLQRHLARDSNLRAAFALDSYDEFVRADKAMRDSELFASLIQSIERNERETRGRCTYLITSSARFKDIMARFSPQHRDFVLSVPAAAYIASLSPGAAFGVTALRSFLFDAVDRRWRPKDFELSALRIAKRAEEYDMPWAKRTLVMNEVRILVEHEARTESGGRTRKSVQSDMEAALAEASLDKPAAVETMTALVVRAMEKVGIDRRLERQNENLRRRVKELEDELKRRPPG